jgi:hypothetical protein
MSSFIPTFSEFLFEAFEYDDNPFNITNKSKRFIKRGLRETASIVIDDIEHMKEKQRTKHGKTYKKDSKLPKPSEAFDYMFSEIDDIMRKRVDKKYEVSRNKIKDFYIYIKNEIIDYNQTFKTEKGKMKFEELTKSEVKIVILTWLASEWIHDTIENSVPKDYKNAVEFFLVNK